MFRQFKIQGLASLLVLLILMVGCACSSSKIQKDMSARQKILKSFYPTLTKVTRFFGVKTDVKLPGKKMDAPTSLYNYAYETIDGDTTIIKQFAGKKIVIVNTASDCYNS